MKHTLSTQQGFTLVEVMIAMFILGVALLTLITMQVTGIKGNSTASQISTAVDWGSSQLEEIFGLPYDDDKLKDVNVPVGQAGLDATGAAADHQVVSGSFIIYWNVADGQPLPDMKTIRVIVNRVDQGQTKSVTMNYVKAKFQ